MSRRLSQIGLANQKRGATSERRGALGKALISERLLNTLLHCSQPRSLHSSLLTFLHKLTASSLRSPAVPPYFPKNTSTMVNVVGKFLYRNVFSRASTSVMGVIVAAFFLERSSSEIADYVFDNANKGKQWKDIKHLYENK